MTSIVITVIDVSAPVRVATAKGGYNAIDVAYRKDGKIEGKKIVDFANKEVYNQLKNGGMIVGKSYEVQLEKVNDYWQWMSFAAVADEVVEQAASGGAVPVGTVAPARATSRVTGSNYETPDERKVKQRSIQRQTCLERALGLLIHNSPKGLVDKAAVTEVAEYFFDWLNEASPVAIEDANKEIMQMKNDIPF